MTQHIVKFITLDGETRYLTGIPTDPRGIPGGDICSTSVREPEDALHLVSEEADIIINIVSHKNLWGHNFFQKVALP